MTTKRAEWLSIMLYDCHYFERDSIIDETHTAILKHIREMVPEPWSPEGSEPDLTDGWNACRTEMLRRIGEK